MKKRGFRKFYTLIEIMTVIVIAAILFGIGIPAFTTMIQGSNMTIAIRQLSSKIAAARAYAVSNAPSDSKVAVLLMEGVKNASGEMKDDYCYSAYRVCIVSGNSSSYTFQEWIEEENWKTLPKGIYRDSVTGTVTVNSVAGTDLKPSDSEEYPAIVFDKKGQMSAAAEITLKHGRYVNGKIPTPSGGADHKLTINQYSGKVSVTEASGS